MSLILGYANKDNAIIMSDGRAGENGCVSEYYNKTLKINNNIIIGFAGFAEPIEHFLKHTLLKMGTKREYYFVDDFWELIQFLMDDPETQEHLQSSFIILGRDKKNDMHTSIIGDLTNYKLESNIVTSPRITAIGGTIDGKIINEIYTSNIKKIDTPIADCMASTICEVAKLDTSVNTNFFSVKI